ncbi:MAG: nucleotide exchange factor GrpE [candidate division WOR-3 bacterium]
MLKKGPVTKLKEAYLELLSEYEAYCQRKEKALRELECLSSLPLLKNLIPVLDNFDRLLKEINSPESDEKGLRDGFRLIYQELKKVLSDYGVEEYSLLGKDFDPKLGEAVDFVIRDDCPPLMVVDELAKGYSFKGMVLRPAKVVVSKNGNKEK